MQYRGSTVLRIVLLIRMHSLPGCMVFCKLTYKVRGLNIFERRFLTKFHCQSKAAPRHMREFANKIWFIASETSGSVSRAVQTSSDPLANDS